MKHKISCIINGKIILENTVLLDKVLIFDEKIIDILDENDFKQKYVNFDIEIINAWGKYVSPGFIDIHIHGSGGKDVMDAEPASLKKIGDTIVKNGVTGFLPTTMTMEKERIHKALDMVRIAMSEKSFGAKILGVHLEGPFISKKFNGAQNKELSTKPEVQLIKEYMDIIKIITLAPEEDFQFEFIKYMHKKSNVVLSIGHTDSDYETAMEAIEAGISNATHIFNAMPPFHHRFPGTVGAILKSDISVELIADTVHIHPAVFQILINAKGKDKIILITDSMRAGSMENGIWELGGKEVIVDDDSARLVDGTLAGSVLTMNKAVYNMLKYTNLEIYEAVSMASINPAKLIGMDKHKGSIEIGKDADLIIFNEELEVELVVIKGEIMVQI